MLDHAAGDEEGPIEVQKGYQPRALVEKELIEWMEGKNLGARGPEETDEIVRVGTTNEGETDPKEDAVDNAVDTVLVTSLIEKPKLVHEGNRYFHRTRKGHQG